MTMKPITLITGTVLALTMTGPAWTADAQGNCAMRGVDRRLIAKVTGRD